MSWYHGKRVLITGGSKGIGRALAITLARSGAQVYVAARGLEALDKTVALMKTAGGGTQVFGRVSFDVSDPNAAQAGVEQVIAELGGLDVLICNSGFAIAGYADQTDLSSYSAMINVNYLGHVHVTRAVLPHFIAKKSGHICLVTSMMGFMGLFGYTAYAGSKFAIVGYAQALRQEMAVHGVNVNVFYPPTTETPGLEAENKDKPKAVWQLESDNSFTKSYNANTVGEAIAAAVHSGRFDNMVGADSWFVYTVNRLFPGLTRWLADKEVRDAIRKTASNE